MQMLDTSAFGTKLPSLYNAMTAVVTGSVTANSSTNPCLSNFQNREKSLLLKA
jgi:hypothetical protein